MFRRVHYQDDPWLPSQVVGTITEDSGHSGDPARQGTQVCQGTFAYHGASLCQGTFVCQGTHVCGDVNVEYLETQTPPLPQLKMDGI